MDTLNIAIADSRELRKQTEYARKLAEKGFDFGFAVGSAFVESMRNTHYRHTGTALDELLDNSIEAGATEIHIAFGYERANASKMTSLAVIDDGHGMVPEMIRLAAAWGGTHRQDERSGFGRFGFGLPSASVNQAKRFTIYSIIEGGAWHSVTVDLEEIAEGKHTDERGKVLVPPVKQAQPPDWVNTYIQKNVSSGELRHGTVVLWEKLDRITWSTTTGMTKNLLQHFGVTYRNYVQRVRLVLDEKRVEPVDPLFITPGYRYFDEDEDRAIAYEPAKVEVKSKHSDRRVAIQVRFARFPRTFFSVNKAKDAGRGNQLARWSVANENSGIIVCRMGRQIDLVERTPWHGLEKFRNNDRYWAIEIDFPAELDEEFTIANSKQGVVMSDRIWEMLKDAGIEAAIRRFRKEIEGEQADHRANRDEPPEVSRPSELSMKESEKFSRERAGANSPERERKAREALEQHVKRRAKEERKSTAQVEAEVEEEISRHPYRVTFANHPGAPFYRVEQIGGQRVLEVNKAHRFYSNIYAAEGVDRYVRAGLEILLFSLGEGELDALGNLDKANFYTVEKNVWSEKLDLALNSLEKFVFQTEIGSEEL